MPFCNQFLVKHQQLAHGYGQKPLCNDDVVNADDDDDDAFVADTFVILIAEY